MAPDRRQLLAEFSFEFSEAIDDYDALLERVARRISAVTGAGCWIRILAADGQSFEPVKARPGEENLEQWLNAQAPELGIVRRALEDRRSVSFALGGDLNQAQRDFFAAWGLRAFLGVPLVARGKTLGLVGLFRRDDGPFTAADERFIRLVCERAAMSIDNARLIVAERAARAAVEHELRERVAAEDALRRSEAQFRQMQKMEAIGRLAGTIAHDFNNLLSVILSYSALIARRLKSIDPMREDVEEIRKAGERAAELTRQLLAFSRQQVLEPQLVVLNDILSGLERTLQRLIGEDVDLVIRRSPDAWKVRVDPGQIEQVLMNLVVNARDAMPTGGQVVIETANVGAEQGLGQRVLLSVTDTGKGMDRETQAHLFEPFFTTKPRGQGTGLGLSTVFGIVQQSGGDIRVSSEPGKGTRFELFLPRALEEHEVIVHRAQAVGQLEGNETILLAEDEDAVRGVAKTILTRFGYRVLEARNAGEALLICERHPQIIHLLVTDVVMPHASGRELAQRLLVSRPEMKVLYMSGYSEHAITRSGTLEPGLHFQQKPFTPEALARKVREVLAS